MTYTVNPKKHLGQHFLRDDNIAKKVADSLTGHGGYTDVLEIGPGTGALSKWLLFNPGITWNGFEVDRDSVAFLKAHFPDYADAVYLQDFIQADLATWFDRRQLAVIGNFPYNISSQIVFKVLENRQQIPEMVGMFQKEVAQRIASGPGNKVYGILSVLSQAFYDVDMLFSIGEHVFFPPPKVKSAVIRFRRKEKFTLDCDEKLFFTVVKTAFNQRRKTLRNALKSLRINWEALASDLPEKRAEQLQVSQFIEICQQANS